MKMNGNEWKWIKKLKCSTTYEIFVNLLIIQWNISKFVNKIVHFIMLMRMRICGGVTDWNLEIEGLNQNDNFS